MQWIAQAARILKPTGSLYICGFSEILADLKHPAMKYFSGCKWLIWHYRNKANLGTDWGLSLIHISRDWSTFTHCLPRVTPGRSPALADFFRATLLMKVDLSLIHI